MKRNPLEWAVLAVSVVAIAALALVLVLDGLSEPGNADPRVELRTSEAREATLGWIIPATVSNAGDAPAEAVVVEAEADVGGQPEASELEIAYLPAGGSVDVAFAFTARPSGDVTVRLVGYRVP